MKINRKGQEEMVGFVLIIVIVAVIFLVFLAIFARRDAPATQRESQDVSQFLESLMEYTSDCAVSYEPAFSKVGELIRNCNDNSNCKDGKTACEALDLTVNGAIEANWAIGPDKRFKGYIFNSTYSSSSFTNQITFIEAGNCTSGNIIGAEDLSPAYPGTITSSLRICS